MKFVCKIEEVRMSKPELYCISKKGVLTQAVIIDFMKQPVVTEEQKAELRECIKTERAKSAKRFMTPVRNKFLTMFYEQQTQEKKHRPLFEEKF